MIPWKVVSTFGHGEKSALKFNCAHSELVDIHKLQENPKNPNKHPDRQIEMLAKIIDYQGQRAPVVVSKRSGYVVKGHGRLAALRSLGWTQAAVDYQDYENEAQEYADMIADNKIAELAQHDDSMMIDEIKLLGIEDFELLGLDDFSIEEKQLQNSSAELNLDEFDNFQHQCPKCGFEWDDSGRDNS